MNDGGSVYVDSNIAFPSDGNWHMVTGISEENGNMKVYVDSLFRGSSSSISSKNFPSINTRSIGSLVRTSSESSFNGQIDETTVWNRPLSQSEVTQLYNSGNGVFIE